MQHIYPYFELEHEQPIPLAHTPRAGKPKALAEPEHGLEALDGSPRNEEGLEATDPGHILRDP